MLQMEEEFEEAAVPQLDPTVVPFMQSEATHKLNV